jgi:hypothetical protein
LLPRFLIQILFEFELASKQKVVHNVSIYTHAKFGKFGAPEEGILYFANLLQFGKFENIF